MHENWWLSFLYFLFPGLTQECLDFHSGLNMKQLHWITSRSIASLFFQSTNFLIWRFPDIKFMYCTTESYRVHAHIAPRYVTMPTRHDYVRACNARQWQVKAEDFNLALTLSLNTWLTKSRVLLVIHEGSELMSQLTEPILSAKPVRSLSDGLQL